MNPWVTGVVFAAILGLIALDWRTPAFQASLRGQRLARNLAFLVAALGAMAAVRTVGDALSPWWTARGMQLVAPAVWTGRTGMRVAAWPAVFLVGELFNWVFHYAKHTVPGLWGFHFQHHRESAYTVWLTSHTHALEVVLSGTIMGLSMVSLGFPPGVIEIYLGFYAVANVYQHSARALTLGPLDWLVVSPAYHRHHHRTDTVNYGSTLTVWDVVFRTAHWPKSAREQVDMVPLAARPEPFGFWREMIAFLPGFMRPAALLPDEPGAAPPSEAALKARG